MQCPPGITKSKAKQANNNNTINPRPKQTNKKADLRVPSGMRVEYKEIK